MRRFVVLFYFIIFMTCFGLVQSLNCTQSTNQTSEFNITQCQCSGLSIWNNDTLRCQCDLGVSLSVDDSCLYPDADTDNTTCQFPCSTCNSQQPTSCLTCPLNYLIQNDDCFPVSYGVIGTAQIDNVTIQCSGGCISCSSYQNCENCTSSYQLINQQCFPCEGNCKTCDNATKCLSCFDGYYVVSQECVQCSTNNTCLQCNSSGCTLCQSGYFVEGGGCSQCGQFCEQCTQSSCLVCQQGYVVPDGGSECIECLLGCIQCSQSDLTVCLQCSGGYYNNSGTCRLCPESCNECSSATICSSCADGYIFQDNECKQACIFPCETCQQGNPNACLSCFGGYSHSGTECLSDLSCNNVSNCSYCPRKYTLNNMTQCVECSVSNCIKCELQNPSSCVQCNDGYYIMNNICQSCPSQCASCYSTLYCTSCLDGYYMLKKGTQPTGQCKPCSAQKFCATCRNTDTQCLSCLNNYELQDTKCISFKNIGFRFVLDTSKSSFFLIINIFKNNLIAILGFSSGTNSYITFTALQEGSVILNGLINLQTQDQAESTFTKLSNSLTSSMQIGNVSLLSAPVLQRNNFQPSSQPQQVEPTTQTLQTGLIVGLCVAGVALIFIIIWGVIRCRRNNRERKYMEESSVVEKEGGIQLQMSF